MKLHHFICPFELVDATAVITDTKVIHHLSDVLKIGVGEKVIVSDGKGSEVTLRLSEITKDQIVGVILDQETVLPPGNAVILYVSLLKRDNFELVVQKATEIGVSGIVPVIAERTVKLGFKRERLEKIIAEAAEQSEQALLPELKEPLSLEEALSSASPEARYFFDRDGEAFKEVQRSGTESCSLWIGPEGGWTPSEVARAKASGAKIVSLGRAILRAETAAIVTAFWAQNFS